MTGAWALERHVGDAGAFHARDLPVQPGRAVWWFEVTAPAVALGSAQRPEVVDHGRARAAGATVVRRRSGGGAVWLEPGAVTWVDLVLPAGDPLWVDDVSRSADWLADVWAAVLGDLGVAGARAHRGPPVRSADADLVCFAGVAGGEVLVGGRKVVGVSQRRTRRGARLQCAVLHRWEPERLVACLALPAAERAALVARVEPLAAGIGPRPGAEVVAALVARLDARG